MKFVAVVVTFNRKALLGECLQVLLQQTQPLARIYVVDNASEDGTPEYLRESGLLDQPVIEYLRLERNLGGAGGFHAGMKAAYEDGADWIWVMDDDAEPRLDAAEQLLPYAKYREVVGIASQKLDISDSVTEDGIRILEDEPRKTADYISLSCSTFVGFAVSRKAIDSIGLPSADFFIHYDDVEYCDRLVRIGTIALASSSVVVHKEVARQHMTGHFMGRTFVRYDIRTFCFRYFRYRNVIVWERQRSNSPLAFYRRTLYRLLHQIVGVLLLDSDCRLLRLQVIIKAYWDGLFQNFDNGFPFRVRQKLSQQQLRAS